MIQLHKTSKISQNLERSHLTKYSHRAFQQVAVISHCARMKFKSNKIILSKFYSSWNGLVQWKINILGPNFFNPKLTQLLHLLT